MTRLSLEAKLDRFLTNDLSIIAEKEQTYYDSIAWPFNESLVVFGAGRLGRKLLSGLRMQGIEPLAFSDSNPTLWGERIDGLSVLSPDEAARRFGRKAAFIVAIWSPGSERKFSFVKKTLTNLGCVKVVSFVPLFWKYYDVFLPHHRIDRPSKLLQMTDEIKKAFHLLADDGSRAEYIAQVKYLVFPMSAELLPEPEHTPTYFPPDIFSLEASDVFVDCGAYDGDTIRTFIQLRGDRFTRIIAFEPDPGNFERLRRYATSLPANIQNKISLHELATASRQERVYFQASGSVSSMISSEGTIEVGCVPLDEALEDAIPTYIKMDIEGAEPEAITGCRNLIRRHLPILGICVYHAQNHLWAIPLLINSFSKQYRFYLRRYEDSFGDLVSYAIPPTRVVS